MPWVHLAELDLITDPLRPLQEFICQTFHQPEEDRKNVEEILVIIENFIGVAHSGSNKIHINAEYVANFNGDGRIEMIGVLYHETTHVWQWSGEAPSGLMEGVTDYVRRKAGWDQGYEVTSYFVEYCDGLRERFVADLNNLMKDAYRDDYFVKLLGKSVDELWNDYKGQYSA